MNPHQKRTLLFVITGLTQGGAELQLYNLVKELRKENKIIVLNFFGGHYVQEIASLGVSVITFKIKSKWSALTAVNATIKVIDKERPHVVMSLLPHANIVTKLAMLFTSHTPKYIYSIRAKEIKDIWQLVVERLLDFTADAITTNAKATTDYVQKYFLFPKKKIHTIWNGYEFAKATKQKDFFPKRKVILTVANDKPQKDYATNLKTASLVCAQRDDIVFAYVGDIAGNAGFKKEIAKLKLKDKVHLLGNRTDVPNLMVSSDIFFLPTLYEGQSNVLIEAMHYGLPIVTTDLEENHEILAGAALTTKTRDSQAMSKAILRLIDDKKLAKNVILKGKQQSKLFSLEKLVLSYKKLLRSIY
ncbi:glycosyltransferase [Candidatus Woesearchaeota archaeon]|nr:glycosyltransferase [Candidatus Woesearchaeota archaeon]